MFLKKLLFKQFFIFLGHGVSLSIAITIVTKSMDGPHRRLPEPIFAADLLSRKISSRNVEPGSKMEKFCE